MKIVTIFIVQKGFHHVECINLVEKKERKNELKLCKHSHQPTHQCPIATLHTESKLYSYHTAPAVHIFCQNKSERNFTQRYVYIFSFFSF